MVDELGLGPPAVGELGLGHHGVDGRCRCLEAPLVSGRWMIHLFFVEY